MGSVQFELKEQYRIEDLIKIMELLRSEEGCPWDREQTHQSIRKNLIEEAYEAAEAIDLENASMLREELGDVLLQVVFHARIAQEDGIFSFDDVCDGICKKLILRHPHIFGSVQVNDSAEVLKNWDAIKKEEKGQKSQTDTLISVPKVLPALMRSSKVQQRAARAGFDFSNAAAAFDSLETEVAELWEAMDGSSGQETVSTVDQAHLEEELGDVLFATVNVARLLSKDPEECLTASCEKFIRRFSQVESLAKEQGLDMSTAGMEVLDGLWNQVKKKEHKDA